LLLEVLGIVLGTSYIILSRFGHFCARSIKIGDKTLMKFCQKQFCLVFHLRHGVQKCLSFIYFPLPAAAFSSDLTVRSFSDLIISILS